MGPIRTCRSSPSPARPGLGQPDRDQEIEGEITEDYRRVKLSRLQPGEQFVYVFDLGDDWAHLCTVGARRIDPVETLGILPGKPLPYWGWGDIPDQYRRQLGRTTTASHPSPWPPGSLIFHRFGLTGALSAGTLAALNDHGRPARRRVACPAGTAVM